MSFAGNYHNDLQLVEGACLLLLGITRNSAALAR
jgi:hypothetical protein